jgi:SnoaL-like domain
MELWELVARECIRDCLARWNYNGDARHMDQMVLVLAPDVEFRAVNDDVLHGRAAVLDFLTGVRDRKEDAPDDPRPARNDGRYLPAGTNPSIRHFTSNPRIVFESETTAQVRTYYSVLSSFGLDHWGRYIDEFGVVDGEWLITKRVITTDGVDPEGWAAALS